MPSAMTEVVQMIIAGLAILSGGLIKGVVGIGAPLVSVPVLAAVYDVPTAIALMTVPLVVSCFWQAWINRRAPLARNTLLLALGGCAAGVVIGTLLLGLVPDAWLAVVLAGLVFSYIALYLARPDIVLSPRAAHRAAVPVGLLTGILQGTAGISTPVSVTFVHAQRLKREPYLLATQSIFTVMAITQIAALSVLGIMNLRLAVASFAGLVPMMAGIWLGQYLGSRASHRTFERLTLVVLALIAFWLLVRAVPGILA
jgi:uncharacterized membrane protein YfcA